MCARFRPSSSATANRRAMTVVTSVSLGGVRAAEQLRAHGCTGSPAHVRRRISLLAAQIRSEKEKTNDDDVR